MALGQILDGFREPRRLHLAYYGAGHLRGPLVLYELADLRGVGVGAYGLIQARGVPQRFFQVADLLHGPSEPRGHSFVGGLPSISAESSL